MKIQPARFVSDTLDVNLDDSKYAVARMDWMPAMQRMRKLAMTSKTEEVWAYLPDQKFDWVELGIKAVPIKVETQPDGPPNVQVSIAYDEARLQNIFKENNYAALFHIHPTDSIRQIMKATPHANEETFQNNMEANALPSGADLAGMVKYSLQFAAEHPGKILKFGLVSEMGVTIFELTPEGIKQYHDGDDSFLEFGMNLVVEGAIQQARKMENLPTKYAPQIAHIQKACALMTNMGNFKIRFIPFVKK